MDKALIGRKEIIRGHNELINVRPPLISFFILLMLILKIFLSVQFPTILFLLVSLMLITTLIYSIIFDLLKNPSPAFIIDSYFLYMFLDLINLSIVIYFLGGVLWIGFVFYSFHLYINYLIFPRRYSIILTMHVSVLYALVVVSQYFNVYPYEIFFPELSKSRIIQDIPFLVTTGIASISFFWFFGYYAGVFYNVLQEKIEALQKARQLIEEQKLSLEIRVGARTRELRGERESLQEKVERRTIELEKEREELTKRVSELEKFHRVAVGRELKMKELKKKIEELNQKLKINKAKKVE
jgi:hypothetical protein